MYFKARRTQPAFAASGRDTTLDKKIAAVKMRDITKRFGTVVANDRVWLDIYRGEVLALLGENGSGKTTLMNMLSGIYFPDEGQILIDGEEVVIRSPRDAYRYGIGMIHQHFKLVDVFTAAENITLGLEEKLDLKATAARIRSICERYGFELDPDQKIYDMSVSQKQTVEIVKVLYRGADILILDEPTAQLDPVAAAGFLSVLSRLHRDFGTTILISEHHLEGVVPEADALFVLTESALVDKSPADTAQALFKRRDPMFRALPAVMQAGTLSNANPCPVSVAQGRAWLAGRPFSAPAFPAYKKPEQKPLLVCKDAAFTYSPEAPDVLSGCSFCVYPGERFALLGANGSGKSTLLSLLSGLHTPYRGKIAIDGQRPGARRLAVRTACRRIPSFSFPKRRLLKSFGTPQSVRGSPKRRQAGRSVPSAPTAHCRTSCSPGILMI